MHRNKRVSQVLRRSIDVHGMRLHPIWPRNGLHPNMHHSPGMPSAGNRVYRRLLHALIAAFVDASHRERFGLGKPVGPGLCVRPHLQ
jgi:hypothetical protein